MEERDLLLKYNLQWFAKEGPGGEKTEPATAKKLKDAREEGKVAKSKEFSGAVDLIVLFLGLKIFGSYVSETLMNEFSGFYRKIPDILLENKTGMTVKSSHMLMSQAVIEMIKVMIPFLFYRNSGNVFSQCTSGGLENKREAIKTGIIKV